ncbi:hypothetical protein LCGC14_2211610 [marine sediment metagenome]|uniref:Uncharacterized protein n=1 Tax=marine sediment metagenome TaxID=412755 RepID=A0A0F9FR54_9ZZZZ
MSRSTRRDFVGGTIAGAAMAIVSSAERAFSKTTEPVEAAVFVLTYPAGEVVNLKGIINDNFREAAKMASQLRKPGERWVVMAGMDWSIHCVPDRPNKVQERVGVLFEFEEGLPRCNARVWDHTTGREFHQVKYCNTATGEICYYRNEGIKPGDYYAKIKTPFIVITEWVKDLRVKCEGDPEVFRSDQHQR